MGALGKTDVDGVRERWFLGSYLRIVASADETDGSFAVMEQMAPVGFSPPLHVHHAEDTALLVLEGHLVARRGDEDTGVGPGEMVWLPRDIPHSFLVDAPDTRFLEFITPAGFEQFHIDTSEPAQSRSVPIPGPSDIDRLVSTAALFGAEILGPPMTASS